MFFKISVLHFALFTGKRLYWRLQQGYFSLYIAAFLRTVFLKKTPPVATSEDGGQARFHVSQQVTNL